MLALPRKIAKTADKHRVRGGILDCHCARRSAGRQVGTKGWSFPIEQRDAALALNESSHPNHDQFAELDAHNFEVPFVPNPSLKRKCV
jgi:hypothetical protein